MDCSLATGFSGPKSYRNFRKTNSNPEMACDLTSVTKITSQRKRKHDMFLLIEAFTLEQDMGGCNSLFFAENQPMLSKKRQSALRYKQAAMSSSSEMLSSLKLMDMESSTESFTDSSLSSTLSESATNYEPSQEDLQALQICGTPWMPQRDLENCKPKQRWNIFPFAVKKNSPKSNCEKAQHDHAGVSTKEEAKPVPVRHFGYTAPLPRPSPWKEVYFSMIKPSEEDADGAMKRQARWRGEKKKQINREEDIQELRRKLSQKIDPMRRKTSHLCRQNTPDKNIAGKDYLCGDYSVTDSSSDGSSTSLNPESTRSSCASSSSTPMQSLDSFDELESSDDNFKDKDEKSKVTNILQYRL